MVPKIPDDPLFVVALDRFRSFLETEITFKISSQICFEKRFKCFSISLFRAISSGIRFKIFILASKCHTSMPFDFR